MRARKGYVAPRGRAPEARPATANGASPELRDALESPLPLADLADGHHGRGVQGPGPEGVGGRLHPHQRTEPAAGGEGRRAEQRPRDARDCDRRQGEELSHGPRHGRAQHAARDRRAREGHRLPLHPEPRPGPGPLPAPHRRARGQHQEGRVGDLRRGGARLRQGEAVDERPGADLAAQQHRAHRAAEGIPSRSSCRARCRRTASSRGPTRLRSSPRSTTTAASSRTRWTSPPPSRPRAARRCSRRRSSATAAELSGSSGGYGVTARIPLATLAPACMCSRSRPPSNLADRLTTSRETVFRVLTDSRP